MLRLHNVGEVVNVPMTVVEVTAKIGQGTSEIQYRLEHQGQNSGGNVCVFDDSVFEDESR